MSDIGDDFKAYKEAQKERRAARLPVRTNLILQLRDKGFVIQELSPYQFRINGVLDIYPTHHRYHDIKKNRRGGFRHIHEFVDRFFKVVKP